MKLFHFIVANLSLFTVFSVSAILLVTKAVQTFQDVMPGVLRTPIWTDALLLVTTAWVALKQLSPFKPVYRDSYDTHGMSLPTGRIRPRK